jgi:hypothetical protein
LGYSHTVDRGVGSGACPSNGAYLNDSQVEDVAPWAKDAVKTKDLWS